MPDLHSIIEYYPPTPYDLNLAPLDGAVDPYTQMLLAIESCLDDFLAALFTLQANVSVQTAAGTYLDAHGILYGVFRRQSEANDDETYRGRILAAINTPVGTIPAIFKAVNNYVIATHLGVPAPFVPIVTVYDLASDPITCTQDAANGHPIFRNDFVISIGQRVTSVKAWFLDQSYLGYDTVLTGGLFGGDGTFGITYVDGVNADSTLQALVTAVKAANEHPVWKSFLFF